MELLVVFTISVFSPAACGAHPFTCWVACSDDSFCTSLNIAFDCNFGLLAPSLLVLLMLEPTEVWYSLYTLISLEAGRPPQL